jgi:hypothetical protein
MARPTIVHRQAAKGVLRYLAGTASCGITFGAPSDGLEAYTDADFAGDIRHAALHHRLRLHPQRRRHQLVKPPEQTVAASTTEAEYMAAASAIKEGLSAPEASIDLGLTTTIIINADNQSAIKLLKNPVFSMRSKHIDVVYHFARERVARGEVSFKSSGPTTWWRTA